MKELIQIIIITALHTLFVIIFFQILIGNNPWKGSPKNVVLVDGKKASTVPWNRPTVGKITVIYDTSLDKDIPSSGGGSGGGGGGTGSKYKVIYEVI